MFPSRWFDSSKCFCTWKSMHKAACAVPPGLDAPSKQEDDYRGGEEEREKRTQGAILYGLMSWLRNPDWFSFFLFSFQIKRQNLNFLLTRLLPRRRNPLLKFRVRSDAAVWQSSSCCCCCLICFFSIHHYLRAAFIYGITVCLI